MLPITSADVAALACVQRRRGKRLVTCSARSGGQPGIPGGRGTGQNSGAPAGGPSNQYPGEMDDNWIAQEATGDWIRGNAKVREVRTGTAGWRMFGGRWADRQTAVLTHVHGEPLELTLAFLKAKSWWICRALVARAELEFVAVPGFAGAWDLELPRAASSQRSSCGHSSRLAQQGESTGQGQCLRPMGGPGSATFFRAAYPPRRGRYGQQHGPPLLPGAGPMLRARFPLPAPWLGRAQARPPSGAMAGHRDEVM